MKRLHSFSFTILVWVIAIFSLVACDESVSSNGYDNGSKLSEQRIIEAVRAIDDIVPGAQSVSVSVASMMANIGKARDADNGPISKVKALLTSDTEEIQGECGGTLSIAGSQNIGNTAYMVSFTDFCAMDDVSSLSGEVIVNGRLKVVEEESPGEFGLTVNGFVVSTEGEMTMERADETISFGLEELSYKYGMPDIGSPGLPSQALPDRLTARRIDLNIKNQEISHSLQDFKADIYSAANNNVLDVTSGKYGTGNGRFDIFTSRPFVMNESGKLLSGIFRVESVDGNVVELFPDPRPGVLEIKFNEEPLDTFLDYSHFDFPLLRFLIGLS